MLRESPLITEVDKRFCWLSPLDRACAKVRRLLFGGFRDRGKPKNGHGTIGTTYIIALWKIKTQHKQQTSSKNAESN